MSLINDALRKAQKQRTGETPPLSSMPAIGGESAVRIAKRSKPAGFYTLLIRLGAGVTLLAVVIIGGAMLLRKKAPPSAPQPPIVSEAPAVKPAEAAPKPTPATTTPAASFVVPVATPAPTSTPPKTEIPAVTKAETPKPAAAVVPTPTQPKPEPVKPAGPPPKLEPRAMNFIESLRVVGIRASATDSKVLMNDRVYRIGDMVEHDLGLKLVGITSSSLTFEDERGGRYTRNF
jgi:hypothetical protein